MELSLTSSCMYRVYLCKATRNNCVQAKEAVLFIYLFISDKDNFYCPQRSWGKVICVKNSVHILEQCRLGDTGKKWTVHILLECILVTDHLNILFTFFKTRDKKTSHLKMNMFHTQTTMHRTKIIACSLHSIIKPWFQH